MRSWRVGKNEEKYLLELLNSGYPGGNTANFTGRLEKAFAERFGTKYAISFCNGTATLHAALASLGVGPGDEVIVPPLTMSSTSLAVLHAGAKPVFADVDRETFVLSPKAVKRQISPRTKAIMPVSLYGLPAPVDELEKFGLPIVEDSAECYLGKLNGKLAGTIGKIGSFSFQNSKHITCGEGGMTVTDDPDLAVALRRFSSLGYGLVSSKPGESKISKDAIASPETIRHTDFGFNFRMSDLCSAFALAQLERLDEFVALRIHCAEAFRKAAEGVPWLKPQKNPANCVNSYWTAAFTLDTDRVPWHTFHRTFRANGGEGFYGAWRLAYNEPWFAAHVEHDPCPNAEFLQPRMIQMKTNYGTEEELAVQIRAFERTIEQVAP